MAKDRDGEGEQRETDREQRIREAVQRVADTFPPLTTEQRERIIMLLSPSAYPDPPMGRGRDK